MKPSSDVTISDIGFQTELHIYLQLSQTWLLFSKLICLSPRVIPVTVTGQVPRQPDLSAPGQRPLVIDSEIPREKNQHLIQGLCYESPNRAPYG